MIEAARLAPFAKNGQPWYFKTEKDKVHLYQKQPNFIKKASVAPKGYDYLGTVIF